MRTLIPIVALLGGCTETHPLLDELDTNRALWADQGADDYRFTVQQACFCPDVEPVDVTVAGSAIAEAIRQPGYTGDEPVTLDPAEYQDWMTVDGLFDVAEDALQDADEVDVEYDADLGYPTRIEIDWMKNAMDDEASYFASDLVLQ